MRPAGAQVPEGRRLWGSRCLGRLFHVEQKPRGLAFDSRSAGAATWLLSRGIPWVASQYCR